MAETKQRNDKSWPFGKWGSLALIPLTVLFLRVTVPLANTLLVIYVYGIQGYEQGIRVVSLNRRQFFSNGEDVPAGTWWIWFGSFFAAVAAACLTVYLVRWCLGHLQKLIGPRPRREHEQITGTSQEESRGGPQSVREVVLFFVCFFAVAILLLMGPNIWWSFDLALHEERTQGVVIREVSSQALIYRYAVDGREYSGADNIRDVEFRNTYPEGSAVEVRYSSTHPEHSTLGDPLLLPKQVLCAIGVIAGFLLLIYLGCKRREQAAEPVAAADGGRDPGFSEFTVSQRGRRC